VRVKYSTPQDTLITGSNPATSMCVFREFYITKYSSLDSYKLSNFNINYPNPRSWYKLFLCVKYYRIKVETVHLLTKKYCISVNDFFYWIWVIYL
jgi:hypothetical protein